MQKCLNLNCKNLIWETPIRLDSFPKLLDHVASAIVDLFFVAQKGGLSWVEFVRGYVNCCGRMPSSMSINLLLRVFAEAGKRAGLSLNLEFESSDFDCKISGSLRAVDVIVFLLMCWTLSVFRRDVDVCLPDVSHLVLSAVVSCGEVGGDFNLWDCDILALEVQLPVGKFLSWILTTVPSLPDCFAQFFIARLLDCNTAEVRSFFFQFE